MDLTRGGAHPMSLPRATFWLPFQGAFPGGHPLVLGQSRGWAWRSEVERNELSNLCSVTADRQDQTTSLRRVPAEPCRYLARNEPQANAAQVAARGRAGRAKWAYWQAEPAPTGRT